MFNMSYEERSNGLNRARCDAECSGNNSTNKLCKNLHRRVVVVSSWPGELIKENCKQAKLD